VVEVKLMFRAIGAGLDPVEPEDAPDQPDKPLSFAY
jgi:cytochrome bd ubiquinol oxidase subunit I